MPAIYMRNMRNDYVDLVRDVYAEGTLYEVRNQLTHELRHVTLSFPDPSQTMLPVGVGRNISVKLAAVEALSVIGGICIPSLLRRVNPAMSKVLVDASDESIIDAAYGPRLLNQIPSLVDVLDKDPSTRQAMLSIWNEDDMLRSGDKPCTISLHFMLRDYRLELQTYMRSNDVWLGMAYDVFVFTQLQHTIVNWLNASQDSSKPPIKVGPYYHTVGSLHLYQRNEDDVKRLRYATQKVELPHGIHSYYTMHSARRMLYYANNPDALFQDELREIDNANPWYMEQMENIHG